MILLRHPPADVAPRTCYGRLDLGCAPGADALIAALIPTLPSTREVRASPARRCRALAEAIAARDGVRVMVDPRLHELDFGAWEGRPWAAIPRAETDAWAADPMRVAPPGGETFAAMLARVSAALDETAPDAILVTHAGVVRAARMILTRAGFAEVFADPVPCCTAIPLEHPARERMASAGRPR